MTVRWLSNNVFSTFQVVRRKVEKSRWTVRWQGLEVTRPSDDCQTTFFDVSSNSEKFWIKSLNGHATVVVGHATVGWLSNNVFSTFQAIRKLFEKKSLNGHGDSGRRSGDRRVTVKLRFFDVSRNSQNFFKKVAERSRDSGRRSRDRLLAVKQRFFDVSSHLQNFWKKSAERSRNSGRRSGDRRLTVKQRFFDVSNNSEKFWKKSLNGHATVVGEHATVGRLWNDVFSTFQTIQKNCEKVAERSRDSGRRSRDRRLTVKQSQRASKRNLNVLLWLEPLDSGSRYFTHVNITAGKR